MAEQTNPRRRKASSAVSTKMAPISYGVLILFGVDILQIYIPRYIKLWWIIWNPRPGIWRSLPPPSGHLLSVGYFLAVFAGSSLALPDVWEFLRNRLFSNS